MNEYQLGQRVRYSTHIQRRHSRPGEFLGPNRIWSTHAGPGMEDKPFKGGEGIVIGKRTLTHGNTTYWGDYSEYTPAKTFTAWLVAFDLRRKPVHVLPEHISIIDEDVE